MEESEICSFKPARYVICNFTSRLRCLENLLYKLSLSYLMCRNDIVFSMEVAPGKFQKQSPSSCAAKSWVYIEQ